MDKSNMGMNKSSDKMGSTDRNAQVSGNRSMGNSADSQMPKATDSKKSSWADKIGDAVEAVGTKISESGARDLGKKIHDAGDRLEKTHKNPAHPVDEDV